MRKHAKCGFVFLVVVFLLTGCAKHNGIDSMDEFIKQNIILDKSTELESYEWINEEILRVRVKYQEQLENAYLHKEDYFFFFEDEELVQTLYVDYPTKDYENIDKDRYVGDACNFEAHMEDVTFDGNEDLIISLGHFGVHGTEGSCAYIYTTEGYLYEPTFEDIPAYETDEENQVIKGCNVDSASGKSEYIYVYENNQFVQKEHTTYLYDETELDLEELILTAEEEKILCDIYVEDERILAGELFDFQIVLVNQIRFAKEYLCDKYTDVEFEILTCSPAKDEKDIVEMTFQDNSGDGAIFNLELTQKDGTYSAVDDYYGKLLQVEYDRAVSDVLTDNGITECLLFTVFYELCGIEMNGLMMVEDTITMNNLPNRTTYIFIDEKESESDAIINKLKTVVRECRLFSSYHVYLTTEISDKELDRERVREFAEAEQEGIKSIKFNCFEARDDAWKVEKITEYNGDYEIINEIFFTYDEKGNCLCKKEISGSRCDIENYDAKGRLLERVHARLQKGENESTEESIYEEERIVYFYDGDSMNTRKCIWYIRNDETSEWKAERTIVFHYDAKERLVYERTYMGDSEDERYWWHEIEYIYNEYGQKIAINMYDVGVYDDEVCRSLGRQDLYAYDSQGNMIKADSCIYNEPYAYGFTYEHDENGNTIKGIEDDGHGNIKGYYEVGYEDVLGNGEYVRISQYDYSKDGIVKYGHEDIYEKGILAKTIFCNSNHGNGYIIYDTAPFPEVEWGVIHTTTDITYDENRNITKQVVTEYRCYE